MDMPLYVQLNMRGLVPSYSEYLKMDHDEALAMLEAHTAIVGEIQAKQGKQLEQQKRMDSLDELINRRMNHG